jgi:hypothetical protein
MRSYGNDAAQFIEQIGQAHGALALAEEVAVATRQQKSIEMVLVS